MLEARDTNSQKFTARVTEVAPDDKLRYRKHGGKAVRRVGLELEVEGETFSVEALLNGKDAVTCPFEVGQWIEGSGPLYRSQWEGGKREKIKIIVKGLKVIDRPEVAKNAFDGTARVVRGLGETLYRTGNGEAYRKARIEILTMEGRVFIDALHKGAGDNPALKEGKLVKITGSLCGAKWERIDSTGDRVALVLEKCEVLDRS